MLPITPKIGIEKPFVSQVLKCKDFGNKVLRNQRMLKSQSRKNKTAVLKPMYINSNPFPASRSLFFFSLKTC